MLVGAVVAEIEVEGHLAVDPGGGVGTLEEGDPVVPAGAGGIGVVEGGDRGLEIFAEVGAEAGGVVGGAIVALGFPHKPGEGGDAVAVEEEADEEGHGVVVIVIKDEVLEDLEHLQPLTAAGAIAEDLGEAFFKGDRWSVVLARPNRTEVWGLETPG